MKERLKLDPQVFVLALSHVADDEAAGSRGSACRAIDLACASLGISRHRHVYREWLREKYRPWFLSKYQSYWWPRRSPKRYAALRKAANYWIKQDPFY